MSIEDRSLESPRSGSESRSIGAEQHVYNPTVSQLFKPQRGDMFIATRDTQFLKPQRGDMCIILKNIAAVEEVENI